MPGGAPGGEDGGGAYSAEILGKSASDLPSRPTRV